MVFIWYLHSTTKFFKIIACYLQGTFLVQSLTAHSIYVAFDLALRFLKGARIYWVDDYSMAGIKYGVIIYFDSSSMEVSHLYSLFAFYQNV